MMYYLIKNYSLDDLCIICVDKRVLDLKDTVVTDCNAACELAALDSPEKGIKFIDFKRVFAKYWTSNNPFEQFDNKSIQCAEVLVLNEIPIDYLVGVYVCSATAEERIKQLNLNIKVKICKKLFFQ